MAKQKITPLNDRILVKRLEAVDTTEGGIVLPDAAKEKPREGEVVSIGAGRLLESGERAPMQINVKDRVIFGSYAGTEIKFDGAELLIMSEDDVLAVIG
ncbi:MAG: co-chaperone GroES [Planctomycetota bacterium]|nr:co-chaperone GroES [Planctomycetota bacterium]MEE3181899.1 co-chaperone GroES [Planctomycetota bacterium]MEE3198835.1 co-chaperone GroES [Planctomycetota bacterium]